MKRNSILFVGCGDLGGRCGRLFLDRGWHVAGVRRNITGLPAGFSGTAADYTLPGSLDFSEAWQPDYVVATFTPSDRSVDGYHRGFTLAALNLLAGLGGHRPKAILLASSTRVFAEQNGGWVDEDSALAEHDSRALAIIAAEQLLQASAQRVCVIRFGGIYGAPGGRLVQKVRRGELSPEQPLRYGNRMHRDDCAGFLAYLVERLEAGEELAPVYIGVDDLPAPQAEVERWLAATMGLPAGPAKSLPGSDKPPGMAIVSGHKRCSNRLLHASGYRLLYPDYHSGYAAVLAAG